jgi:hypothetical protein
MCELVRLSQAWVFLRDRFVSRSFVTLFVVATNFFLFDVTLEAYAKNTLSLSLQQQIASVFANGIVVGIYLGSVLEALVLSIAVGYITSMVQKKFRRVNH